MASANRGPKPNFKALTFILSDLHFEKNFVCLDSLQNKAIPCAAVGLKPIESVYHDIRGAVKALLIQTLQQDGAF